MKNRFWVSHKEHVLWQIVRVSQRLLQYRSSLKIKMTSWWASSFVRLETIKLLPWHGNPREIPWKSREYFWSNGCCFSCKWHNNARLVATAGLVINRVLLSRWELGVSFDVYEWVQAKSKNIAINEGACDPWNSWNLNQCFGAFQEQWRKY